MKHTITKAAAVAALAAGALFAVPAAASAVEGYTPPAQGQVSDSTVAPGEAITFSVTDAAFVPGETVSISITGENASGASLGFVKFAVETRALGTTTANGAGGVSGVRINLPANASGTYTILATSPSNPVGVSATVTVAAAGTGSNGGSDDDALATTGPDSAAMLGLWVGGGALVLAGGAVAVASAVRRNRDQSVEA
ncbi:hypothetical protein AB0O65_02310 [Microbacterium sp. NPDC077391]|uniref:hypothetical protein n=1 Tax=Microbacterium sp. NPDC077391 TaxID=3154765 RepID=UPI0034461A70